MRAALWRAVAVIGVIGACDGGRADVAADAAVDRPTADAAVERDQADAAPDAADAAVVDAFGWAVSAGGEAARFEVARVALDAADNVYVAGVVTGEARFGDRTLGSEDQPVGFVTALDADGRFLWTLGAIGATAITDLVVDPSGASHLVGSFTEAVSFGQGQGDGGDGGDSSDGDGGQDGGDGGGGLALEAAWEAIFVLEIDSQGRPQRAVTAVSDGEPAQRTCGYWHTPCGDGLSSGRAAIGPDGDLYLTARARGPVSFGSIAVATTDALVVARLRPSEDSFLWAVPLADEATSDSWQVNPLPSIAVATSRLYVAGALAPGSVAALACPQSYCPMSGPTQLLVAGLDAKQGSVAWTAAGCLSCGQLAIHDVVGDGAGTSALVAGSLHPRTDHGPVRLTLGALDLGQVELPAAFVARVDRDGAFEQRARLGWQQAASAQIMVPEVRAVALDGSGRLHLAGTYHGPTTLGSTQLPPPNDRAAFVVRLGPDGEPEAATSCTSSADALGLAASSDGDLHLAGRFGWPTLFGDTLLEPDGPLGGEAPDLFVWKLRLP